MIICRIDEGEPRKEIEVLRCIVSHIAQATLCHAVIACSRPWAESMYDSLIKGEQTSQWSLRLRWKPWYVLPHTYTVFSGLLLPTYISPVFKLGSLRIFFRLSGVQTIVLPCLP